MARVITFSDTFPDYHAKAGEPTNFAEKITSGSKVHTIRAGNRWRAGMTFSPRRWTGKPYRSKQEIIMPDLEIKKVWSIEIYYHRPSISNYWGPWQVPSITFMDENGCFIGMKTLPGEIAVIAHNDGLELEDFIEWFPEKSFAGQIICWDESIKY